MPATFFLILLICLLGFIHIYRSNIRKGKWYRYLPVIAAIFIVIGGVGWNTDHAMPYKFYISGVCLAIGVIIYGTFLFMITRERMEENSN